MKKRIGDVAKAAGVGVETVRFYQRVGLLDEPEKPHRGWRAYGKTEQLQLRYVKLARRMGLSVADIAKLKKRAAAGRAGFCTGVRDVVAQRLAAIEAELAELQRTRDELASWLSLCKARGASSECPLYREVSAIMAKKKS
jgi:DNA-binding transcriptional MerR regulator